MFIIKLKHHIFSFFALIVYKIIYGRCFKVGKKTTWRSCLSVMIAKKGRIIIGENCFFNNYCSLNANVGITIGDNTLFGENVKIYDHNHRFSDRGTPVAMQGYSEAPVSIGSNCWIGSNVTVLKGANIGDGCVIGAGAVISGTIPANTVVRHNTSLTFEKIRG